MASLGDGSLGDGSLGDGSLGDGQACTIRFAEPEYGVAPGQAAVIYAGDRVIGGGWIAATVPADAQPSHVSSMQP